MRCAETLTPSGIGSSARMASATHTVSESRASRCGRLPKRSAGHRRRSAGVHPRSSSGATGVECCGAAVVALAGECAAAQIRQVARVRERSGMSSSQDRTEASEPSELLRAALHVVLACRRGSATPFAEARAQLEYLADKTQAEPLAAPAIRAALEQLDVAGPLAAWRRIRQELDDYYKSPAYTEHHSYIEPQCYDDPVEPLRQALDAAKTLPALEAWRVLGDLEVRAALNCSWSAERAIRDGLGILGRITESLSTRATSLLLNEFATYCSDIPDPWRSISNEAPRSVELLRAWRVADLLRLALDAIEDLPAAEARAQLADLAEKAAHRLGGSSAESSIRKTLRIVGEPVPVAVMEPMRDALEQFSLGLRDDAADAAVRLSPALPAEPLHLACEALTELQYAAAWARLEYLAEQCADGSPFTYLAAPAIRAALEQLAGRGPLAAEEQILDAIVIYYEQP